MKKERFVNPAAAAAIVLLILSCGVGGDGGSQPHSGSDNSAQLRWGPWQVSYVPSGTEIMHAELISGGLPVPDAVDSLHFEDQEVPDSLKFNRSWELGSGSSLTMSVTVPFSGGRDPGPAVREVLSSAELITPHGLRSVRLSDRSVEDIDSVRALVSVEPPPGVSHYMNISFTPEVPESCLIVTDSMVVRFIGSNTDSLEMQFSDRFTSVISVAGRFNRGGTDNSFVCFADSQGIYSGVFIGVMGMNTMYLCPDGEVAGQARLTSAFLTGKGLCPVSGTPEDYLVTFSVPEEYTAWTPLEQNEDGTWQSGPGGVIGGLPVAIGSYFERTLFNRYTLLSLDSGVSDSLDTVAIERLAGALLLNLNFPMVQYSFVEVVNPDGDLVIPGFASLMFSRGSLDALADVSSWPDLLRRGEVPPGWEIITGAAEGFLVQSLQLDPVLFDMFSSWMPLRFYESVDPDPDTIALMREVWMKNYLYNTEYMSFGGTAGAPVEYSLADPELVASPLRPYVAGGKGVIILEYLYSRRMLNRLPYLLHSFTHASSANYWARICTSLRVSSDSESYRILERLFYLPGIPQIRADWREENGYLIIETTEIQPGPRFDLPLESCTVHFQDTTVVRDLEFVQEEEVLICETGLPWESPVLAIDLNPDRLIPADFTYRRADAE